MLKFLTGAATLALAASVAMADPGNKGGPDGGGNGGGKSHAQRDGGQDHGDGGGRPAQADGGGKHADRSERGGDGGRSDQPKRDRNFDASQMAGRHGGQDRGEFHNGGHGEQRGAYATSGEGDVAHDGRGKPGKGFGNPNKPDRADAARWAYAVPRASRGLIAGCPPGLAQKDNGCLPPGLARKNAARAFYDSPTWWNFDDRWHDTAAWNGGDYRYYDGYLVRSGSNGIDSWLPLLGGALAPGNQWPSQYASGQLSPYYQDYYGLGSSDGYRYYDDTLYRVDPQSQAITAITALLTGNSFQVGQRLPTGYDVYNVPYSYRDRYADGPDANYRYSDGTIYRVDPTTQLVQAVIELLT